MKTLVIAMASASLLVGCSDSNRTGEGAMGGPGSDSSTRLGSGGTASRQTPTANSGPQNSITNHGALGSASAGSGQSAASTSGAPLTTTGPLLEKGGKEVNPDKR